MESFLSAKDRLQMFCARYKLQPAKFKILHKKIIKKQTFYWCEVEIDGLLAVDGMGLSKRFARMKAAENALHLLAGMFRICRNPTFSQKEIFNLIMGKIITKTQLRQVLSN